MKNINLKNIFSNLFNKEIYREGLRQSSMMGWFLTIAVTIINCLTPFAGIDYNHAIYLNPLNAHVTLIVCMFIVPLLFSCQLAFVMKRKACDFYHSAPIMRKTLFISFAMAGLTWLFIVMTSSVVFSSILYNINPYVTMSFVSTLKLFIPILIGCFLIYSITLFGMSITGNKATAVIMTLLILLLPVFIQAIYINNLKDVSGVYGKPLYSHFGIICAFLQYNAINYVGDITRLPVMLWSLAFGVVMFVLATVVFVKRKSELAGHNAPNTLVQLLFCTAVGLPLGLFITLDASISMNMTTTIITLIVNLIICLSYQLATTRSFKKLKYGAVAWGICIVFSLLMSMTCFVHGAIIDNRKLDADNIKYATLSNSGSNDYIQDLNSVKISDDKMLKIIATGIDRTKINYNSPGSKLYYQAFDVNNGFFTSRYSTILNEEEMKIINDYVYSNEDVMYNFTHLPPMNKVEDMTFNGGFKDNCERAVLQSIYDEFESMPDEKKIAILQDNILNSNNSYDMSMPIAIDKETYAVTQNYTTMIAIEYWDCTIRVNLLDFPNTFKMMFDNSLFTSNTDYKHFYDSLDYYDAGDVDGINIKVIVYDIFGNTSKTYSKMFTDKDVFQSLIKEFDDLTVAEKTLDNYTVISFNAYYVLNKNEFDTIGTRNIYCAVDNSELAFIGEYLDLVK